MDSIDAALRSQLYGSQFLPRELRAPRAAQARSPALELEHSDDSEHVLDDRDAKPDPHDEWIQVSLENWMTGVLVQSFVDKVQIFTQSRANEGIVEVCWLAL